MSTEMKNKWRLLHELVLKVKEAKDFETLGNTLDELAILKMSERENTVGGSAVRYNAINAALEVGLKKLEAWQKDPPPIAPQETQIGPGNPFPPPPPPPPTVAGENINAMLQEYISIDELKERVQDVLRPFMVSIRDARMINGDFARESMNLISERIDGVFSNVDAKPPTVAHREWTGALVFERIAPQGLTNPVGYRAATPEEQAELDRMARAINRNTPLFEPKPQAPGSLDELRKTVVCAITSTSEKDVVYGKWGGADVGLLLNALVRKVDKAFADYAAQNAKAIERAAEPVKTLEPWTVDRLKLIFDEHDTIFDLDDDVADLIVSIFNDENKKSGKAMGHSTHAAEFPKPWTGEELYLAAKIKVRAIDAAGDYSALTNEQQVLWMLGAAAANARMGVCSQ